MAEYPFRDHKLFVDETEFDTTLVFFTLWTLKFWDHHSEHGRFSLGGYSPTIPIQVCAAQRGRDFGTPDLEWEIHFTDVS